MIIPRFTGACALALIASLSVASLATSRLSNEPLQQVPPNIESGSVDDVMVLVSMPSQADQRLDVVAVESPLPPPQPTEQLSVQRQQSPKAPPVSSQRQQPASSAKLPIRSVARMPASRPAATPEVSPPQPAVKPPALSPLTSMNLGVRQERPRDLTPAEEAAITLRDTRSELNFRASVAKSQGIAVGAPTGVATGWVVEYYPVNKTLTAMRQIPQDTYFNCAPATLQSILAARNITIAQAEAARLLRTQAPYGSYLSDMPAALSAKLGRPFSVAWVGPTDSAAAIATAADKEAFRRRLVTNIGGNYGMAAVIYELAYGPRLPGHPVGVEVHHFIGLRGYENFGEAVLYSDSAANASSIGWPTAQPYGKVTSNFLMDLVAGKGYTW